MTLLKGDIIINSAGIYLSIFHINDKHAWLCRTGEQERLVLRDLYQQRVYRIRPSHHARNRRMKIVRVEHFMRHCGWRKISLGLPNGA